MSVPTKNPYAIFAELGNDEGDETPVAPVKTVDKTSTHTAKRNTDGLAPAKGPVTGGNRRGGAAVGGSEAAFRDRNAGRESNRGKPTEETPRGGRRGGYRGRGGRREEGDRHPTKSAPHSNSEKQAAQSWGANEGQAELKDEQAAAEIAQTEQKEGEAAPEGAANEEEEDKHITLDQYLAQQAEKKLALESELKVRKPNEGVKDDKWKDYAPIAKKDEDEELFAGSGGKTKKPREHKAGKTRLEYEPRYVDENARGGRGAPRGGRGAARGEGGRGRGDGARGRGRGAPRGEFRGDFRGGRGRGASDNQAPINTSDKDAFPSLGA